MKVVTLVSGGLDSTVMSVLIREEGIEQFPVFVNYGQINLKQERKTCLHNFARLGLPAPRVIDIPGYGAAFRSGLTDAGKDIVRDAFLPGRNMLFLLCAAAVAHEVEAEAIAMGLLNERLSLFPDQRRTFLESAKSVVQETLGRPVDILTPLMSFGKPEVLAIARERSIDGTYSCHAGTLPPCGKCIACREYAGLEV
jgi:7-cyano-7-deazaguanine synthase